MASPDCINRAIEQLSENDLAAEMLLAAADGLDGALVLNDHFGAPPLVQARGCRSFGSEHDRKSRAAGYAAFQLLRSIGLLDHPSGVLYPVTDLGWGVVEKLKATTQHVQKQVDSALEPGKRS
jgi:hypothetical protein